MKKTIRIDFKARNAGYALFIAAGFLCLLSFLVLSLLALSKARLENIERQSRSFYSELHHENEKLLSEWKNENQGNDGGR